MSKRFVKYLILLFLSPIFSASLTAQQMNCSITDAPALLNLKLQMSPEQAQGAVGKDLKIKFKTRDEKIIFQNYIDKRPPPSLSGVRALYLRFFDRRLYQIEVFYEEIAYVKTLDNFVEFLAANRNFPVSDARHDETGKVSVICPEFTVVADKILNPRVEITDEITRAKVEEIRERKKKK